MSDHNTLPPDDSNRIDLETLVDALAENKEIGQPSEYFPSSGRVLEDSVDGTVYLGDGDQWLPVGTDAALATPAVSTADVQNNMLLGDINYNDPLWMALHRGMTYRQNFEGAGSYRLNTQNSGSTVLNPTGLILQTGSTADSYAGYQSVAIYPRDFSTTGDRWAARLPVRIRDDDADVFIAIGSLFDPISSPEDPHVGFYFSGGTLEASAGDNTTHTREQITSSYSSNAFDTWGIDMDYKSEVRLTVYKANNPGIPKQTYTLSSGLPDTNNPDIAPQVYVNNESSSGGYRVDVHKSPVMVVRKA